MSNCLDETAIKANLRSLQGWQLSFDDQNRPAIEKDYSFVSFDAAFAFVGRVALIAERSNHHPELFNRYRRGLVRWTRNSNGGVTALDLDLAANCDKMSYNSGLKVLRLLGACWPC